MLGAAGSATKEVEVKKEDQAMELAYVIDPTASSAPTPQVAEAMRKV